MSYLLLILAVILGVSLVFLLKPSKKFVQILLAFSGAYLLSVTILHLVPEVYVAGNDFKSIGIYILIGIILQSVLESFSKGSRTWSCAPTHQRQTLPKPVIRQFVYPCIFGGIANSQCWREFVVGHCSS